MKLIFQTIMAGMLITTSAVSTAEQKGGDKSSLLCALTNTVSCDSGGNCESAPATAVNLPVFMLFHPDRQLVESAREGGERRVSEIKGVSGNDDVLVLLGDDETSGWGVRINKVTGNLTGTIVTDDIGYLLFGSCIET